MKTTADQLKNELAKMHSAPWVFFDELRIGTGYGRLSEQSFDGWAINPWSKNGIDNLQRAFEIKVSASDLKSELMNPDKRWMAHAYSHEFYFVCPEGLCDRKRLENHEGLIEWDGEQLKITKRATKREIAPPRWGFVAALARRIKAEEAKERE